MSKSIHTTLKNFRGLTKKELFEQYVNPDSDLAQWAKKRGIKNEMKRSRKNTKDTK